MKELTTGFINMLVTVMVGALVGSYVKIDFKSDLEDKGKAGINLTGFLFDQGDLVELSVKFYIEGIQMAAFDDNFDIRNFELSVEKKIDGIYAQSSVTDMSITPLDEEIELKLKQAMEAKETLENMAIMN